MPQALNGLECRVGGRDCPPLPARAGRQYRIEGTEALGGLEQFQTIHEVFELGVDQWAQADSRAAGDGRSVFPGAAPSADVGELLKDLNRRRRSDPTLFHKPQ
jgi:hypothetical protein